MTELPDDLLPATVEFLTYLNEVEDVSIMQLSQITQVKEKALIEIKYKELEALNILISLLEHESKWVERFDSYHNFKPRKDLDIRKLKRVARIEKCIN